MSDRLRQAAQAALEAVDQTQYSELRWEANQLRAALAEQTYPVMDLGGDIQQTTALAGGLVNAANTSPERGEKAEENEQVAPVAWGPGRLIPHTDSATIPRTLGVAPARREWQSLTDKEIVKLIPQGDAWTYEVGLNEAGDFARAIEAALKEKNHG